MTIQHPAGARAAGWLPFALLFLAAGPPAGAAPVTLTLQRGLEGYGGAEDTFLYAPSVVANVNYGADGGLSAGINRWKELYVSLLRFRLDEIPPAARVTRATLWLCSASKEFPSRDLVLTAQAISPANADWVEGGGDGSRTPTPGAACWSARRYGAAKWAGETGLRKAGVDTVGEPVGTATVAKAREGWVELPLNAAVVQEWIRHPEANPGLRLFPLAASLPGDVAYFRSSDYTPDPTLRPKLVLELEVDDAAAQGLRRTRALRALGDAEARLAEGRAAITGAGSPPRATTALRALERDLAARRGALTSETLADDAALQAAFDAARAVSDAARALPGQLALAQAAAANERLGLATDFALAAADSMDLVLRSSTGLRADFGAAAEVDLARNEFEAVQVVLLPLDRDLLGATWSVTALRGPGGAAIPASDVSVSVLGYLKARKPALPSTVEWWPGPILDFMKEVDVRRGEAQPLWVSIRTRENTPAGAYAGALTVRAKGVQSKSIALRARVFDFAVPREQHLLTIWGNNEATYRRLYGERFDKAMAGRMFDFFLEHRLAVNDLYAGQAAGKPIAEGWATEAIGLPTLSDPAELRRMWDAGSRWWNLGYVHPVFAQRAGLSFEDYLPKAIEMLRESLKVADAAGWPHANLGIYFFDETTDFAMLHRAASRVKAAFPDIALMTTGYDRSYGVKGGPIDASIDIWCPLTPRYAEDQPVIAQGREKGKKAWWYVCVGPRGSRDLNFFSQFPGLRGRLLMGAAAWKYRPDGFLYYRVSGWTHYPKPIEAGPLTDWVPYFLPGPDGDGELICPGPNGPLSTPQFESIRDGLEDYEYYWLLRDRVEAARRKGLDVSREEGLLLVAPSLLTSLTLYSDDPARLRAERRRLAEAIEGLSRRMR